MITLSKLGQRQLLQGSLHAPQLLACASSLLRTLQQLYTAECARAYATGRRPRAAVASSDSAGALDVNGDDDDEPPPVLTLPSDLSAIGALNPRLREVILQHESLQKSASAVQTMLEAIEAATPEPKRPQRLTRSALTRLRVDQLRALLEQLGGDPWGTKEVVVQRLLDMATSERRQQEMEARGGGATAGLREGVIGRLAMETHLLSGPGLEAAIEAALRGEPLGGMPESSLREAHRAMVRQAEEPAAAAAPRRRVGRQPRRQQQEGEDVEEGGQPGHSTAASTGEQYGYSRVFTPEEVADIFAEARGQDVLIIDVRGRCAFTDWMVLATARSQQLARMLAAAVLHQLKARAREVAPGVAPTIEGELHDSEWLVVDAGSVVAHVFLEGYREEYALEELWGLPDGRNIRRVAPRKTVHTLDSIQ